jgi:shikimate kinase
MTDTARAHLVLVGLMGAGKTTVARECAARLSRPVVDTDDLVTAAAAASVAEIFAAEGEAGFRARERAAVADACASPVPLVVACGGGAVLDPDNRRRLRAAGVVVWLDASTDELAARVGRDAARPLLGADPAASLERLRAAREAAYGAVADVVVDTTGRTVDEVVDTVLAAFSADAGVDSGTAR